MNDEKMPVAFPRHLKGDSLGTEAETSLITARFGVTVRRLRHRLGVSQEALAERADLHRTYIADVEGGRRNVTLKTMERLARGLEVSLAALLTQAGETAHTNVDNHAPKP
jgi:transcriptional regulator with XRE-family HTH domain